MFLENVAICEENRSLNIYIYIEFICIYIYIHIYSPHLKKKLKKHCNSDKICTCRSIIKQPICYKNVCEGHFTILQCAALLRMNVKL